MENKDIKYCPECGSENKKDAFYCSDCGYNFVKNKSNKKTKIVIISIIAFVTAFCISWFVRAKMQENIVYSDCVMATYSMLDGAAQSEKMCNEICDVWHDSIWQTDDSNTNQYTKDDNGKFFEDFNDALSKYASSDKYADDVKKLSENYEEVIGYMTELRKSKIPETLNRMYDEVEELYDLYIEFYNMPIIMNGSYNTFSDDFDNIDKEFMNKYEKVTTYITK